MEAGKINTLINAANVGVESYWGKLFAKAVQGQNLSNFFNFAGGAGGAPAQEAPKEVPKEDKGKGKKDEKKAPPPKE